MRNKETKKAIEEIVNDVKEKKRRTAPKDTSPEKSDVNASVKPEDIEVAFNEKYLRLFAEYDNFRKRAAREMSEISKTANEELMKEFLSILDNLDLATEHKNDKTTFEEYVKGIALIEDQLRDVLSHAGLEAIEALGKPFDPNIHEAVMQMESDEYDSGIVANVVQKGYMLSGKVIRHSKVIVSK